jgi:hypothetical protein
MVAFDGQEFLRKLLFNSGRPPLGTASRSPEAMGVRFTPWQEAELPPIVTQAGCGPARPVPDAASFLIEEDARLLVDDHTGVGPGHDVNPQECGPLLLRPGR